MKVLFLFVSVLLKMKTYDEGFKLTTGVLPAHYHALLFIYLRIMTFKSHSFSLITSYKLSFYKI